MTEGILLMHTLTVWRGVRCHASGLLRIWCAALFLALLGVAPVLATEAGNVALSGSLVDSPKPIKAVTLTNYASVETRSFPGYLKARFDVQLSFRVSGPLVELPALTGKIVKKDELLARIDPRDYASNLASITADVQQASEQLQSLQQARPEDIMSAEAAVEAAKATAENDRVNLERNRNLYEQKVVPKITLDQAQATSNVSASALEQAIQNLQKARVGARIEEVNAAQANLDSLIAKRKATEDALRDTELRAPFAGIVSDRYVENHQFVAAKERVLSIQDLNTFEVVINFPEQLLILNPKNSLLDRTTAVARFDVIPGKVFPLTFKEFSTRADVQAQTFAATFYLSPEDKRFTFLPGMTVTVDVTFKRDEKESESSFILPPEAILSENDGKKFAWLLNETDKKGVYTTKKIAVTVGEFTHTGLIVTSGMKIGEKYAATGAAYLKDGMLVTELTWEGK